MKKYGITILISFLVMCFTIPVAKFYAKQKPIQLWEQEQKQKNSKVDFKQEIDFDAFDTNITIQQHVKETENTLIYEVNNKKIEVDKNTVFSEECSETSDIETNPKTATYTFVTYYIYALNNFFIEWCDITNTNKYDSAFYSIFNSKLSLYDNYLKQHSGKNYKKCNIEPLLKARKEYDFNQFDIIYSDAIRNWTTKQDFCNKLKNDSDFMLELFSSIKTEEIDELEKQQLRINSKETNIKQKGIK